MFPWLGLLADGLLISGAWWLAAHGLRQTGTVDRILATAVLALTACLAGLEVLGTAGLLAIGPLIVWAGAFWSIGLALRWLRPASPLAATRETPTPEHWRADVLFSLGMVLWTAAAMGMESLLLPVKVVSDGPIYHLYFAARWWKAARLLLVAAPFGENAATYFPANGDLWFTWLMVTWNGDRLARIGQVPFLFLAAVAVYGIARRLGASRNSTLVAICWFVTSTPLLVFTFEANVDTIFVAAYLISVFFVLRALADDGGLPAFGLAGMAAGIALGTKPVGVVFVPPLILLVLTATAIRTGSVKRVTAVTAAVLAAMFLTSAFWFGRNLLLTGNPLYPLHVAIWGRTILPGWYGRDAMRFSPYYLPISEWRALVDTLLAAMDPRLAPIWLAAMLGAWAIGARRDPERDGWTWAVTALALLNVVLYWICIPYRTQQRFMLQALGLLAIPLARSFDRWPWLRLVASALLTLHLLTPQAWPVALRDEDIPWDFSVLIPSAFPGPLRALRSVEQSGRWRLEFASGPDLFIMLGAACCSMAAVWSFARWRASLRGRWLYRGLLAGGAVGLLGLTALGTGALEADPRLLIYPAFLDYYRGWQNLEGRSGPSGSRVAYAGTNIPYYLMGGGLRNEVRYVNIDGHADWLLHDYHRAASARGEPTWPNARPGWDRGSPDYQAWLANLRAQRIQLLVVTKVNPGEGPHNVADAEGFPIERVWADRHPDLFEPLYGLRERDPLFRLYRLRRPT
jgi:hypothetical protein